MSQLLIYAGVGVTATVILLGIAVAVRGLWKSGDRWAAVVLAGLCIGPSLAFLGSWLQGAT